MVKRLFTLIACATMTMASMGQNPLLNQWNTPHQTPPFSQVKPEHFSEAVPVLIETARKEIQSIIDNKQTPTFDNTIAALDRSGEQLSRATGLFYNLTSGATNDQLQKVAMELSPILTAYGNDISLNEDLFAKVKFVYDAYKVKDAKGKNGLKLPGLTKEQSRLLEKSYKDFTRSGVNLSKEDKAKYREISEQLSKLSLQFDQNELAATNAYTINITNADELKGMPDWAINGAKEAATEAGQEGYLITLHAPSYIPVLTYCQNRELREKLWRASSSKAFNGEFSNQDNVKQIVALRAQLAQLLGYKTYADFALENRMAGSIDAVNKLLNDLYEASYDAAKNDVAVIQEYAKANGFEGQLQSWDFGFWSEKYRMEKFSLSDDMTRPYFKLENCEKALFMLAEKLYGVTFKEAQNIEVIDPEARAFEVFDKDGKFLSVLYLDYFPRASKNSGAWMNTYRDMYVKADGSEVRPLVTLVCNFTKPTADRPSLLSFDEFTTLLHEFGHGLHGMLAKGNYCSVTGTSVYRDFVELPSQIMENFGYEKEFLDMFAVDYQTGEKIPQELIDKIVAAKNFNAAYTNIRQLTFGMADMAWHTITDPIECSVEEFEKAATDKTTLLPKQEGACMATAFGHIFAGGYAAGYYSYKWAEVLEADAFNQFLKHGIFDQATADKFKVLLESGGTVHPMELYINFAGAAPTVDPLLEKMGLKRN